ncbi:hypothetical protein JTE90_019772 [Oedothorax gibbosus]|uniref:Uncharacterized protein n=1 Tax=Oedothorax gibbosus TaxID=931172 RepID=A0AAV6UP81_9ARAC|nr:hypothetical protein JTE90_019772 [Oedothorax gibbosus]
MEIIDITYPFILVKELAAVSAQFPEGKPCSHPSTGMEFNFNKLPPTQNILYNNFDHNSIMINGNDAFSKNGQPTIVSKNGQALLNPFEKEWIN